MDMISLVNYIINNMFKYTLAIAALLGIVSAAADHWAVLVAGSNGYHNYRH